MFSRLALAFLGLVPTSLALASQGGVAVMSQTAAMFHSGVEAEYETSPDVLRFNSEVLTAYRDRQKYDITGCLVRYATELPDELKKSWEVLVISAQKKDGAFFKQVLEALKPSTVRQIQGAVQRMIAYEWYEFVEMLSEYCASLGLNEVYGDPTQFRFTVLLAQSVQGNLKQVQKELAWQKDHGCDINRLSNYPLCALKFTKDEEVVRSGGWVNVSLLLAPKAMHSCPLHAAVGALKFDIVAYLLQQGIDQDVRDHEGYTAQQVAQCWIEYRLKRDIISKKVGTYGKDSIKSFERRARMRNMLMLFKKYSQRQGENESPLIIACIRDARKTAEDGSCLNRIKAATALKLCPGLASHLLTDGEGNNPLHLAVLVDDSYLTELILELNPGLYLTKNNDGSTALELAYIQKKWKALGSLVAVHHRQNKDQKAVSSVETEALAEPALPEDFELTALYKGIAANSQEAVYEILVREPELYELRSDLAHFMVSKAKFSALNGAIMAAYERKRLRDELESASGNLLRFVGSAFYSGLKLLFFFK